MVFNSYELSMFQATAEDTFQETCTIYSASQVADSYGDISKGLTAGSPISCGIKWNLGKVSFKDAYHAIPYDAELRLPENTILNDGDKIKIDSDYYAVVSPIIYGLSCTKVLVERVVV